MRFLFTFFAVLLSCSAFAGNFQDVVTTLNSGCAFSTCHDSENLAAGLDFSGTQNDIWNSVFNVDPLNADALAKGYKLVKPGDPQRSLLYRKINWGLHADSQLESEQGDNMPPQVPLEDKDIEMVRQWILFGAKNNSETNVDPAILEEYYTEGGLDRIEVLAPPPEGEGFQLHFGPIFLAPGEETELIYRYELQNDQAMEINKFDLTMNPQSHHFLFFKFDEGAENNQPDGILEVDQISSFLGTAVAISSDTKMVGGWAYSDGAELPLGTAYKWKEEEVLKFNYHILNYSTSSVLPAEVYINVYTQEEGEAVFEMYTEFDLLTANPFDSDFQIPPGLSSFEWDKDNFAGASNNEEVHIWALGAHTHKFGIDFDIYDQSNDEQIYEGFYNLDYTQNIGYYDYAEPPFRKWNDELYTIVAGDGLLVTADFDNTSNQTVSFGLTTEDEMFGLFYSYIVGDKSLLPEPMDTITEPMDTVINPIDTMMNPIDTMTALNGMDDLEVKWNVYPNPSAGDLNIDIVNSDETAELSVYNVLGQKLYSESLSQGTTNRRLDLSEYDDGFYFIQIQSKSLNEIKKVALQR